MAAGMEPGILRGRRWLCLQERLNPVQTGKPRKARVQSTHGEGTSERKSLASKRKHNGQR
jgi:hypothetical protein